MKKYRKTKKVTVAGLQLKKKVKGNRGRAKFVGFILLLATIALAVAVAILPMLTGAAVSLKITEFWEAFTSLDFKTNEGLNSFVVALLYGLMLLGVIINVLRSLGKLKGLYKKKGTKADGFNHSGYAMNAMGKIFSGSFAVVLVTYFLINLLCKDAKPEGYWLVILLGTAVLVHLFTGVLGAKLSYFDFEGEQLVEQKREVGRFAPFFRNFLQLCAVFAIMYFLLKANTENAILSPLVSTDPMAAFRGEWNNLIVTIAQIVAVLCVFVLAKHATAITEYGIDGAHGAGMKNFRVFSFFLFLAAGAAVLCNSALFIKEDAELDINLLIVAAIAFVMFVIELIMRKMPRLPEQKVKKEKGDDSIHLDDATANAELPQTFEELVAMSERKNGQASVPVYPPMAPLPVKSGAVKDVQGQSLPYVMQTYYPVMMPSAQQAPAQPTMPAVYPIMMPSVQQAPAQQAAPTVHILPVVNLNSAQQPATPAPAPAPAPAPVKEETEEVEEEVVVVDGPKVEVDCPFCGKRLRVNSGAKYHRCPVCERVFAIRGKSGK